MPTTVELGFDLFLNGGGNVFTLDDPVKGVLGGTTYTLAGEVLVDVTSQVREVSVRRGRSRTLEKFTAGLAQVTLDNRGRDFDPTYAPTSLTRTNLVTNPSFEVDTSGWTSNAGATIARSTASSVFGSASCLITQAATAFSGIILTETMSVTAGVTYRLSVYVRGVTASQSIMVNVHQLNAGGGIVAQSNTGNQTLTSSAGWTRYSVSFTAASTVVSIRPMVMHPSTATAGDQFYVDGWLFEQSSTLGSYFDGSVFGGTGRVVSQGWNGTANASTSYLTQYVAGTGSPYYGSIVPRKQVRITRDGQAIYRGNVESWSWDYGISGDATAEVQCVDGFAAISQALMTAGTAPGTSPGARIGTALAYAGWPAAQTALSAGNAVLDSDVIGDEVNVLQYVQKVEASEQGAFFMGRTGLATFLSRADLQNPTSGGVTFGGTGIPIVEFQSASLTDELRNDVRVTYTAGSVVGGTATASNATSIQAYGAFDYTLDTLLSGNLQAQRVADWLAASYSQPKYRIDAITVLLESLTTFQQQQVLGLDLGQLVTVQVALPNVNAVGTAVAQTLVIDQVEHRMLPDRHYVTFTMSEATAGFVLDSTTFGVLNTSKLGF